MELEYLPTWMAGIFTYMNGLILSYKMVGKYSSPMDPMGMILYILGGSSQLVSG